MSILKQRIKRKTYEVDSAKDPNLVSSVIGQEPKAILNKRMEEKQKQSLTNIESKAKARPAASLQKATLKKVNAILDTRNNLLQPSRKEIPHAACMESKVQGTLEGLNRKLQLNTNFNTFLSVKNAQTFLKGKSNKNTQKKYSSEDNIKRETKPSDMSLVKTSYNWVLNKVHPHHYSNILGYRYKNTIINPSITLHGVRRVLHFLKNVIQVKNAGAELNAHAHAEGHALLKSEKPKGTLDLIVVIESSVLNVGSQDKAQVSSASLVAYSLLRLQQFSGLKILPKTTKETIRYLTTGETTNLCGVLMLNPAKSVLGSLADTLFNKKNKKLSAGNAIGTLCSKKGIPLISLCDISSPLTLCTYPIICDTRDIKSIYYVFDLLTYGLNQLTIKPVNT